MTRFLGALPWILLGVLALAAAGVSWSRYQETYLVDHPPIPGITGEPPSTQAATQDD